MYKCKCGREFEKSQSYVAHCSHCRIHLGHEPEDRFGESRAWMRGRTVNDPVYGESIKRSVAALNSNRSSGMLGHNQSLESKAKQSATRKLKYKSGELKPARGVGRGKYSYLTYGDKTLMLRSTYEFIFALYLLYNEVEFEYESVRVSYEGKTFISDFLIRDSIIEIKGNYHADTSKSKKAFESAGYSYEVKFWKDISYCYDFLKSKLDIDSVLESIKSGHDSRNYYHHKFQF